MKRFSKIAVLIALVAGGSSFAYAKFVSGYPTYCVEQIGGPGLCVTNPDAGGYQCNPVTYLGDCSGTHESDPPQ